MLYVRMDRTGSTDCIPKKRHSLYNMILRLSRLISMISSLAFGTSRGTGVPTRLNVDDSGNMSRPTQLLSCNLLTEAEESTSAELGTSLWHKSVKMVCKHIRLTLARPWIVRNGFSYRSQGTLIVKIHSRSSG